MKNLTVEQLSFSELEELSGEIEFPFLLLCVVLVIGAVALFFALHIYFGKGVACIGAVCMCALVAAWCKVVIARKKKAFLKWLEDIKHKE